MSNLNEMVEMFWDNSPKQDNAPKFEIKATWKGMVSENLRIENGYILISFDSFPTSIYVQFDGFIPDSDDSCELRRHATKMTITMGNCEGGRDVCLNDNIILNGKNILNWTVAEFADLFHKLQQSSKSKQYIKLANLTLHDQTQYIDQYKSFGFDIDPKPLIREVSGSSDAIKAAEEAVQKAIDQGADAILIGGRTDLCIYITILAATCEKLFKVFVAETQRIRTSDDKFVFNLSGVTEVKIHSEIDSYRRAIIISEK
jgi:hypothetical protein